MASATRQLGPDACLRSWIPFLPVRFCGDDALQQSEMRPPRRAGAGGRALNDDWTRSFEIAARESIPRKFLEAILSFTTTA